MSGGIVVIPCAFLACSAPFAITSATSLPSMTALQPGMRSPHLRTFGMMGSFSLRHLLQEGATQLTRRRLELSHDREVIELRHVHDLAAKAALAPRGGKLLGLPVVLGTLE